ncbi:membrane protein [Arthrobacter phage TforTroy]|uniref:Membrane protein n=1 Tax=Arthrobacter phage TforTroy TaxID=3118973 RepID=A0ABZ2CLH1_9CAUD
MGLLAAILWVVFVTCGAWEAVGLPALGFWDGMAVMSLGVALIATVERD